MLGSSAGALLPGRVLHDMARRVAVTPRPPGRLPAGCLIVIGERAWFRFLARERHGLSPRPERRHAGITAVGPESRLGSEVRPAS
jgi:hypothetical protein